MNEPGFWIQLAALLLAAGGALCGVYAVLDRRIRDSSSKLHARIDETQKNYVRRDDLRDIMQDIKGDMGRIERGQENVTAKVDQMVINMVPALTRVAEAAATMVGGKK